MTLPQATELMEYWRDHPPVHELVAAYLGYEKPMTTEQKVSQGSMSFEEFAHYAQKTGGKVNTGPPPK